MKLFKNKLTLRLFTLLLIVVVVILDANAKALKKIHDNSQETLVTAKMTKVEDGLYQCHHHQNDHTHHHRKRRYVDTTAKFHTMVVLWHVTKFSAKLSKQAQLSVFKEAFNKWHIVSRLNFSYTNNATEAHIKISFLTNYFNDGPGGTLAHAYSPEPSNAFPGEIRFDEDENWVASATGGVNLLAVALHEIGHAIGLKHSHVADAVMSNIMMNNKTQLQKDDILAIRRLYGKCEVRDITAVLHDRFASTSDTVLVMNKGKIYRISTDYGGIVEDPSEKWPKDIRDYYRVTDAMYDKVFPLRAAFYAMGDVHVYLFGQNHFIRRTPKITGGDYNWSDIMTWKQNSAGRWIRGPEGPLSYSKTDIFHTPHFFKNFSTNNAKFGASFEVGCCYWQHFFMNGTHYKISTHNFNKCKSEDMSVNFPGAPRNPDASWYNNKKKEWYFFKADKYYKWDASVRQFTDRGPISLLWYSVCD